MSIRTIFKKHFNSNKSLIFLLPIILLLVIILTFQNCGTDSPLDLSSTSKSSDAQHQNCESISLASSSTSTSSSSSTTTQFTISYDIGGIVAYLPASPNIKEDQFSINTKATLESKHYNPSSNTFKWDILRASIKLVEQQSTTDSKYDYTFTQQGAYDISAWAYQDSSQLTEMSKRLVIGDECYRGDILRIVLKDGSLTAGGEATFELKKVWKFFDINWKITLPSGNIIQKTSQAVIVDLSSESAGTMEIEVSAIAPKDTACLTYRKKTNIQITSDQQPHFNPHVIKVPPTKNSIMALENNDILKYKRPSDGLQKLHLNIYNSKKCAFRVDKNTESKANAGGISCKGEIDIGLGSDVLCKESTITLWGTTKEDINILKSSGACDAKNTKEVSENSDILKKQYYNYCAKGCDFCYFGPVDRRPGHHNCRASEQPICNGGAYNVSESGGGGNRDGDSTTSANGDGDSPSAPPPPNDTRVNSTDGQCGSFANSCYHGTLTGQKVTGTSYTWYCVGSNSGHRTNTAECSISKFQAQLGQCDQAYENGCSKGVAVDIQDTHNHYRWQCVSLDGTHVAHCSIEKEQISQGPPEDGECGSSRGSCSSGEQSYASDTPTHWRWRCSGINGGRSAPDTCKIPREASCDETEKYGCSRGSSSTERGSTEDTYTWKCKSDSVTSDQCEFSKSDYFDGECDNSVKRGCAKGKASFYHPGSDATYYYWQCKGSGGGSSTRACKIERDQEDGDCGSSCGSCLAGFAAYTRNTSTACTWTCQGIAGGEDDECSVASRAECGPYQGQCTVGTSEDLPDTSTHYKWKCTTSGGTDYCDDEIPVTVTPVTTTPATLPPTGQGPQCGSTENVCLTGSPQDTVDTPSHYQWTCSVGSSSTPCSIAKD